MIETDVFVSVVLRGKEWFDLMVLYVREPVLCVVRVKTPVLKMWDGKPQAHWSAGCVQCGRQLDCLLVRSERAGCQEACDQLG